MKARLTSLKFACGTTRPCGNRHSATHSRNDSDLALHYTGPWSFSTENWAAGTNVIVSATPDSDYMNSTAQFTVTASDGIGPDLIVRLQEWDQEDSREAVYALRDDLGTPLGAISQQIQSRTLVLVGYKPGWACLFGLQGCSRKPDYQFNMPPIKAGRQLHRRIPYRPLIHG